jgi:hypothetical protein
MLRPLANKEADVAKKVYAEMRRLGWMEYLEAKTGGVPRPIFE